MEQKILIVGVLDVPQSTNVFMKKGFEDLGYTVEAYNYRTRANELGSHEAMWGDFAKTIKGKEYELILFSKTNGLHPELISYANRYAKTWYWFMDNIEVAKGIHADEYAKHACFASATSQESSEFLKESNPNTYQLIEGFDPSIYYKEDLEKKYDITFVGNATPKRIEDLKVLMNGFRVAIFGQGWPAEFQPKNPVYNSDLRRVICQSKVILNLVHSNIFSDRVITSLACGGLVLSQYCEDLEENLKGWVSLFKDPEEFMKLADMYIHDEQVRDSATRATVDLTKKHYTWKAVCKRIMINVNYATTGQLKKNILEPAMTHDYRPNFMSFYVKQHHKSLLDISCGKGAYLRYWRWKGLRVFGTEGDPELVDYNKKQGFDCRQVDLDHPYFVLDFLDDCFDVVTCTEVLEHIKNPKEVVEELIRVAKELVIITTPVGQSYASPDHINHWNNYMELSEAVLPPCDHTIHEIVTKPEDWPMKQRCFLVVINK